MKNYKLIVTDMDGTVLGEDHRMTDGNKHCIENIGVEDLVFIATVINE